MELPDSSPETEVTVEQTDVNTPDVTAAESSTAESQGVKSLLDVVNSTLDGAAEKAPDSEEQGQKQAEPEPKAEAPAGKDDLGGFTDDEFKALGRRAQDRIRQLVGETKGFREELEPLREKAQIADQILDVVRDKGLSTDDLNNTVEIAALIKSDPFAAFKRLEPIYQTLSAIVGKTLPDDLQEQVRLGYLTAEHAHELASSRNRAHLAESQRKKDVEERAAREEQDRWNKHVEGVSGAVSKWENSRSANDPDWNLKKDRVHELVELEIRRSGYPDNQDKAVAMAEKALERVESELKKLRPAPQAKTPVTGGSSPRATPAPKSILDIVNMHSGG